LDIDAVYTWVNHQDEHWQSLYQRACSDFPDSGSAHETAKTMARFQNRNELLYSIKSVKKYAPWVRYIYVVTNCELPPELASDVQVIGVTHEAIFPDVSVLPNFNSRAIESNLHRIEGLSEKFLYFNDDFFLCRPVRQDDFFTHDGKVCVFPSKHDMPYEKTGVMSPFEHGALNACRLVYEETGYVARKRLHHAPYALSRSTLDEIENKYRPLIDATRTHKFRHNDDIPLATSMHAYYCVAHDRGELRDIACRYVDIGDPLFLLLVHPFSPLRRGKYMVFCMNEITEIRSFPGIRDRIVARLLQAMFRD
jgi:hypothetical protein